MYINYTIYDIINIVKGGENEMLKGMKIKAYPNRKQQQVLACMFGNQRFVWNQMLNMLNQRYQNNKQAEFPGKYELNALLPTLKQEYPFLKISNAQALQMSCEALFEAFKRFFKHIGGHPKFHSRKASQQSFTGKQGCEVIGKHYVKLPKLGYLRVSNTAGIQNHKIKRYTVSFNSTGKFFLSVNYEDEIQVFNKTDRTIGIDLNTGELAVFSDKTRIPSLNVKPLEHKLRLAQRKLSRRYHLAKTLMEQDQAFKPKNQQRKLFDFPNYQRQKKIVARLHEKIKNKRYDYIQKITTDVVKQYDTIVIENLKVSNMVKNHHLAHKIEHQAWYEFRRELEYKCQWYGKRLIVVDPQNTSRICSSCGAKNHDFDHLSQDQWLAIREWTCPKCKKHHDRDINAAQNILDKGLTLV